MWSFSDKPLPQQGVRHNRSGGVMVYFLISVIIALILASLFD